MYPEIEHYSQLSEVLKMKRKEWKITQADLARSAGVGLRLIRDMEQGKSSLRMDKVNQVLRIFGYELSAIAIEPDYEWEAIMENFDPDQRNRSPEFDAGLV